MDRYDDGILDGVLMLVVAAAMFLLVFIVWHQTDTIEAMADRLDLLDAEVQMQQEVIESLGDTLAAQMEQTDKLESDIAALRKDISALKSHKISSDTRKSESGWQKAVASWYGTGFIGRRTASGAVLTPDMLNVAHRTLPFGTRILFRYKGRECIAVVNDRGPFVRGRTFDLGPGTAKRLAFSGVDVVYWRIVR
jgi:rare lipoprotein A